MDGKKERSVIEEIILGVITLIVFLAGLKMYEWYVIRKNKDWH
jgi:hypothetical protein